MRLTHPKGIKGEDLACRYLTKNNWVIIQRNWHCRFGEIDIIAKQQELLVFFEVKLRSTENFGGVIASISPQKIEKLKRSIACYLQAYPCSSTIRIDALLIQENHQQLTHIENIIES